LLNIHRKLFSGVFPEHAGKLRLKDVTFRSHVIPAPGRIQYRLTDIVKDARHIIEQARNIGDREERIQTILPQIARFHADCVVIQPFIDGNKRWARQVLSALLVDCGFWPVPELTLMIASVTWKASINRSPVTTINWPLSF